MPSPCPPTALPCPFIPHALPLPSCTTLLLLLPCVRRPHAEYHTLGKTALMRPHWRWAQTTGANRSAAMAKACSAPLVDQVLPSCEAQLNSNISTAILDVRSTGPSGGGCCSAQKPRTRPSRFPESATTSFLQISPHNNMQDCEYKKVVPGTAMDFGFTMSMPSKPIP